MPAIRARIRVTMDEQKNYYKILYAESAPELEDQINALNELYAAQKPQMLNFSMGINGFCAVFILDAETAEI